MNSARIGVLTFHRCINYGSYWQTRCLVEGLQQRGYEVEILDHQAPRINFVEWKCALQPVLPTPVPKSDHALYRQKIEKFLKLFESLPMSPAFHLDNPVEMAEYDMVVVGSDEVWNLAHPWYGYCQLFYGDDIRARRLISYAASFGNYDASWGLEEDWAAKLHQFESISVRDENSQAIVKNALGFEPQMVLDPCLQFPVHAEERDLGHLKTPYVAVYGHNFSGYFINKIRAWANAQKLPLISIGYRNDWADEQWLTADPHDFVQFIAGSEAVVTNFFHGCVFALKQLKPFVCETSPYRSHKVAGLMKKLGAGHHLMKEDAPAALYHSRLTESLDAAILQKIDELRDSSNSYLDLALGSTLSSMHERFIES